MTKSNNQKQRLAAHRPSAVEYDSQKLDVLKGHNFQGLLDPPNLVRVFVSSTFHDFVQERNYLYNNAFRTLETWCRERGLEFQVVDLRWGVRPGQEAFNGAAIQCLMEVEACQKVSVGPNFVAFLGDRYGFRPLPPVIPDSEWKIIMDNLPDKSKQKNIAAVYQLDENSVPPQYLLNTENEDDPKLRDLFEKASAAAVTRGLLTDDKAYKYFASITEQEIWKGILTVDEPEKTSLCFIRNFTNFETLKPEMINKQIGKYIDLQSGNVRNEAATKLLNNLKKFQVPMKLDSSNLFSFSLKADLEQGMNPQIPDHQQCLEKLSKLMVEKFQYMITEGIKRQIKPTIQDSVYREVAQHASFCMTKCQLFTGRKSFIVSMIKAIETNEACQPVVIWGESGVGKTAAMAKLTYEMSKQLKPKTNIIYRFLGTTAASSTVDQLLLSLSLQIAQIYGLPEPTLSDREFNNLRPFFANMLKAVGNERKDQPLIILIDSTDQLSPVYGAFSMNWLPTELPKGVTIVLSAQPQTQNILARLQARIKPCNVYQIRPMSNKSAGDVIKLLVEQAGRKLTDNQMSAIDRVVSKNSSPLLIHLIALEAIKWRSFTTLENNRLPSTIRDAVQYLFDRLEKTHGKVLVGRALGYLVLSRNGLSEKELQEILSLDDDVLQDLYEFWEPPNAKLIQLPPMQWARFKYDMTEFISHRTSDDMTVITLYHQQFIEVILARYVNSASERKRMYRILADFYSGKWNTEPKALKLLINHKEMLYNPFRGVISQPLKLGGRYNLRKLNHFPYYLIKCGAYETLNSTIFYNYEWLDTKYKAINMKSILDDFALLDRDELDNPLNCVKQTIRLAKVTLEFPDNQDILATEFLGRLKLTGSQQPAIRRILEQCETYCTQSQETLLVPLNQCFLAANGLLLTTLVGHKSGVCQILETPDQNLLITSSFDKTIRVWDLETDTLMHILDVNSAVSLGVNDTGLHVFIASKDCVLIHDLKTGILLYRIEPPHEFKKKTKDDIDMGSKQDVKTSSVQCQIDSQYVIVSCGNCLDFYEITSYKHKKRFQLNLNTTYMKVEQGLVLLGAGMNSLLVVDLDTLKPKPCRHDCDKLLTSYVSSTDNKKGRVILAVGEKEGATCIFSNGKRVSGNFLNHYPTASSFFSSLLAVGAETNVTIINAENWATKLNLSLPSNVTQLQFVQLNDDVSILVGCHDATVRLFDSKGTMTRYLTGFWSGPTNFFVSKTRLITSSADDPFVKLWELGQTWGPDTPMLVVSLKPMPAVFCNQDGTFVVCSTSLDGKVINVADAVGIKSTFVVESQLIGMFMTSANSLVTVEPNGLVNVRSLDKSGHVVKKLTSLDEEIITFDFSVKNKTAAFLTKSQKVSLVNLSSAQEKVVQFEQNDQQWTNLYLALQGCFVVYGKNNCPTLINGEGKVLYQLQSKSRSEKSCPVRCATTNGKLFACYSDVSDEIQVHNLGKETLLSTVQNVRGAVACMAITDDDTFLIVGMSTCDNMSLAQKQIYLFSTTKGSMIRKFFVYSAIMQIQAFGHILGVTTALGYFGCFRLHSSIETENIAGNVNVTNQQPKEHKEPKVHPKSAASSTKTIAKKSKTCVIL